MQCVTEEKEAWWDSKEISLHLSDDKQWFTSAGTPLDSPLRNQLSSVMSTLHRQGGGVTAMSQVHFGATALHI